MADRALNVNVKVNKDGSVSVLGDLADDAKTFAETAKRADDAADKMFDRLEKNAPVSKKAVKDLQVAVDEYREALQKAEKEGGKIGGGQEQLKSLEQTLERATASIQKQAVAQKALQRATEDAAEAAGAQIKHINGLDDILQEVAEELGTGAMKFVAYGTAAIGAFTAGWEAGKKLNEVLDQLTDGQFSKDLKQSFSAVTDSIVGMDKATGDLANQQRVANEVHVLTKNHIDAVGKSAAEVDAIYAKFAAGLAKHRQEVEATDKAYADWVKNGIGPVGKELDKAGEDLVGFIAKFKEQNKQLTDVDLAKIIGPQIDKLLDQYKKLKQEVPPHLQAIADEWHRSGTAATQAAAEHEKAAAKVTTATVKLSPAMEAVVKATDQLTAALEKQAPVMNETNEMYQARADAARRTAEEIMADSKAMAAFYDVLDAGVKSGAAAVEAARQLATTLGELHDVANKTGPAVAKVFNPAGVNNPYIGGSANPSEGGSIEGPQG